jgi:tetratricopeptide (TPR) repeat protein
VTRGTVTALLLIAFLLPLGIGGCSNSVNSSRTSARYPGAEYHKHGVQELKKGNYVGALEDFTQTIRLEPDNPKAFVSRGMTYFYMQEFDKALSDLTQAIKLDPNDTEALANRGGVYVLIGEFDKAIADEDAALEIEPNFALAFINRGAANFRIGALDDAIADESRAIELAPHAANAYDNRGICYCFNEQWDKAMADINEAIKLDPKMAMAYSNRGLVFFATGEPVMAMQDFYESIQLDPNLWLGHSNLAAMLSTCADNKFRDGKKALQHAETACKLTSWKEPECLSSLAAAYAELGEFEKAVHWQQEALEKTPTGNTREREKRSLFLKAFQQGKPYRAK